MIYIWIGIVITYVPVLFASFFLFDRIVRAEYFEHRAAWDADGQPHGFFWVPWESTYTRGSFLVRFGIVRLGSALAHRRAYRRWLLSTPDWIKRDRRILRLLYWWRGLLLGWTALVVSFFLVLLFR